jgi:hypothetical protein
VVDEHRRRARWKHAEAPDDLEMPRSTEARDLLRRIASEVVEPEERRALDWLVREHEGDSLYLIALDQALEPSTLRQRICRLRKSLRARYLVALLVALGLGTAWAALPFAGAPSAASVSDAVSPYAGTWRVTATTPAEYERLHLNVNIDGSRVRVFGATESLGRDVAIERLSATEVTLRSGNRVWVAKLEQIGPNHVRLSTARGSVELQR